MTTELENLRQQLATELNWHKRRALERKITGLEKKDKPKPIVEQSKLF